MDILKSKILFKILAPQYLTDLLDLGLLIVPRIKRKNRGDRTFTTAGPKL